MKRSGRLGPLVIAVAMALLAASCGGEDEDGGAAPGGQSQGEQGRPVTGGTLIDYQNFASGDPDHIDPALAHTIQGSQPGQLLFDGLTDYDYKTGELKPAVAESWSSNADATVWTFRLRNGVTFSNGDPVLPSDFKFAWERAARKEMASEVAYHITDNARIRGTKAIADGTATTADGLKADDAARTLTVELEAPLSFLPDVVAHLIFSPVPAKVVQGLPDQTKWEQDVMIGNGPYKMVEPMRPGQYVKLTRNDTYWGGINNHKAYIDNIEFRISKDLDSAWAAFEAGQGQTGYIPPARYAEAKAKYPGRVAEHAVNGLYYWGFNMRDPIVGGPENVKLRQAISVIIDKQRMINDIYNGSRKVATGVTPPGIPGYKQGLSQFPTRDVNRARQLLGEWERATGKRATDLPPIKLNFGAGAGHAENATIIQANLRELGINSELDGRESRTYFSQMRQGQGQFFRSGWIADYNSYDNMLFPLFGSSNIGTGDNHTQFSNQRFDQLIDQARRQSDLNRRNEAYQQAEGIVLNEETAVVPLNWYAGTIAWSDRVRNVIQSALLFVAYEEAWLTT
ncbi:MAG: peptide ABC transporter substrate-binding protein [Actinomycetota bacterium]|nr:peptide ABC transporter substrate-binding protein [Actinomycetota bacterium]